MKKLVVVTILILNASIISSAHALGTSWDETSIEDQSDASVGRPFKAGGSAEYGDITSESAAIEDAKIDANQNAQNHCLPLSYRRNSDFVIIQRWYGMVRLYAEYVCVKGNRWNEPLRSDSLTP